MQHLLKTIDLKKSYTYIAKLSFMLMSRISKRYFLKGFLFIINILVLAGVLFAQDATREVTITAYLYNIPKHVSWKNEESYQTFDVLLITDSRELAFEMSKVARSARIKGKPINLKVTNELNKELIKQARLIFISDEKIKNFLDVFDQVEGKPILLVSQNYRDKRFAMINLYDTETGEIRFEVNRANLYNQGLEIDDEILLLGGSFIDVAEEYRKSQQSLRNMQKQLDTYQHSLDSLQKQVEKGKRSVEAQLKKIAEQDSMIKFKEGELNKVLLVIEGQKNLISKQQLMLYSQRKAIEKQVKRLNDSEEKLKVQHAELDKGRKMLDIQASEIRKMDSDIKEKENKLNELTFKLIRQKQISIYISVVLLVIIFLVILNLRASQKIRKKNIELKYQKQEIEEINEELQQTNEELNSKNEELIQTLEKLKETQNQLIQSEKMASLGVLTAGIAHELNNPINFVYAGANSLKKDLTDFSKIVKDIEEFDFHHDDVEKLKESIRNDLNGITLIELFEGINETIEAILVGANRSVEIVKGLRNFSRMEKDEWKNINITSVIDDALLLLKNKYKNNIEIVKDYSTQTSEVECIPGKINQVLLNIINNAIDAIKEKGTIWISTKPEGNFIRISVKDNGVGIEKDDLGRIFDPFYTTKEVGKGVGLGLSISYGIIEEHSGTIKVISEVGKGTEFQILIPFKKKI